MTIEQEAKERDEFERWCRRCVGPVTRHDASGDYSHYPTLAAWQAWKERAEREGRTDVC